MKLCIFSHHLRVERAEPFAEGLALGVKLDGRRPRHTRMRAGLRRPDRMGSVSGDCVGSVCGDRMGHFCGGRMGSVCGDRVGSVCGDRVGRLICYTESRSTC